MKKHYAIRFILLALGFQFLAFSTQAQTTRLITNTLDTGVGSLRAAVAAAHAGDIIRIDGTNANFLHNGITTIILNSAITFATDNLVFKGFYNSSGDTVKVSGNNACGIFNTSAATNITLDSMYLIKGDVTSGEVNFDYSGGGAVFNSNGSVIVANSAISNCTAYDDGDGYGGNGGGVYANGNVSITNSTISGNSASSGTGEGGGGVCAGANVSISNSTILVNRTQGLDGGGVYANGNISIINSTISGNTASSGEGSFGGGVSANGSATIINSTISGNTAGGGRGGGVAANNAIIINSIISVNTASGGGGVSANGFANITSSTISGNIANRDNGGGVYSNDSATISNSTISGNIASSGYGGGVYAQNNTTSINSTISGNTAEYDGGGVNASPIRATSSIIALNMGGDLYDDNSNSSKITTDGGYNIFTDVPTGITTTDQTGATVAKLILGALANNGGSTLTMLPAASSISIHKGNPVDNTADQRGNIPTGIRDVGAVSTNSVNCIDNPMVINNRDTSAGSLRQAVLYACPASTIRIMPNNFIGHGITTILLTSGEIVFAADNLVFKGFYNSSGDTVKVSGNNASRIFNSSATTNTTLDSMYLIKGNVTSGEVNGNYSGGGAVFNSIGSVTISNSVISNCTANDDGDGYGGNGGGVFAFINAIISNATIIGNTGIGSSGGGGDGGDGGGGGSGGGVYANNNATIGNSTIIGNIADIGSGVCAFNFATISNSTISGNTSNGVFSGGGVVANNVTIINSTISGNTASGALGGGGVEAASNATISNSTISGNTASGIQSGGGVEAANNATISNSTISGNTAYWGGGVSANTTNATSSIIALNNGGDLYVDNSSRITTDGGYNIFSGNPTNAAATDQTGATAAQLNLGALANNGGSTLTMLPNAGSIAVGKGNPKDSTNDQRGYFIQTGFIRDVGAVTTTATQVCIWSGAVSTAWENPLNWSCGSVPGPTTNVVINAGIVVLSSSTAIRSFTVNPTVSFTIKTPFNLTILN